MRRQSKHGTTYTQGSTHVWGDWQVPPVLCAACGLRVTLKQPFYASHARGTFHRACVPYTVTVSVT